MNARTTGLAALVMFALPAAAQVSGGWALTETEAAFPGFATDLAMQGDRLLSANPYGPIGGQAQAGAVQQNVFDGTDWVFDFNGVVMPTPIENDLFGISMSWRQNLLVVGAGAGYVAVFDEAAGAFTFDEQIISADPEVDGLGFDVATEGTFLLAGAPFGLSNGQRGRAQIYANVAGDWQLQKDLFGAGGVNSQFGNPVALSSDHAFAVDLTDNLGVGAIYVFGRDVGGDDNWGELQVLRPSVPSSTFGTRIRVSDDGARLVVGAPTQGSGVVYVFDRQGGTFAESAILSSPIDDATARFGTEVELRGSRLWVAAEKGSGIIQHEDDPAVFVFEDDGSGFVLAGRASSNNPANNAWGRRLAADGDHLAISGPGLDLVQLARFTDPCLSAACAPNEVCVVRLDKFGPDCNCQLDDDTVCANEGACEQQPLCDGGEQQVCACANGFLPPDCTTGCGDGVCGGDEDCSICPQDCTPCVSCGDGSCAIKGGENNVNCAEDCPGVCGDFECLPSGGETVSSCPTDCLPNTCPNGVCELGEAFGCIDCINVGICGDGECSGAEDCLSCDADCGTCTPCGDGTCNANEDCNNCPGDCGNCPICPGCDPNPCGDGDCTDPTFSGTPTCACPDETVPPFCDPLNPPGAATTSALRCNTVTVDVDPAVDLLAGAQYRYTLDDGVAPRLEFRTGTTVAFDGLDAETTYTGQVVTELNGVVSAASSFSVTTTRCAPALLSVIVADPDQGDDVLGVDDTVTLRFGEPTNRAGQGAGVLGKVFVDAVVSFDAALGSDYEGAWIDDATFVIRLLTSDGTFVPGATVATISDTANLLAADGIGDVVEAVATVEGNFGVIDGFALNAPPLFSGVVDVDFVLPGISIAGGSPPFTVQVSIVDPAAGETLGLDGEVGTLVTTSGSLNAVNVALGGVTFRADATGLGPRTISLLALDDAGELRGLTRPVEVLGEAEYPEFTWVVPDAIEFSVDGIAIPLAGLDLVGPIDPEVWVEMTLPGGTISPPALVDDAIVVGGDAADHLAFIGQLSALRGVLDDVLIIPAGIDENEALQLRAVDLDFGDEVVATLPLTRVACDPVAEVTATQLQGIEAFVVTFDERVEPGVEPVSCGRLFDNDTLLRLGGAANCTQVDARHFDIRVPNNDLVTGTNTLTFREGAVRNLCGDLAPALSTSLAYTIPLDLQVVVTAPSEVACVDEDLVVVAELVGGTGLVNWEVGARATSTVLSNTQTIALRSNAIEALDLRRIQITIPGRDLRMKTDVKLTIRGTDEVGSGFIDYTDGILVDAPYKTIEIISTGADLTNPEGTLVLRATGDFSGEAVFSWSWGRDTLSDPDNYEIIGPVFQTPFGNINQRENYVTISAHVVDQCQVAHESVSFFGEDARGCDANATGELSSFALLLLFALLRRRLRTRRRR